MKKLTPKKDFEGDVKYHLGASANREFDGNLVHISLTDNPSHLEAVNPMVLGQVRAKQYFHKDKERKKVIPVLIHGDAAFAGQDWLPNVLQCQDYQDTILEEQFTL